MYYVVVDLEMCSIPKSNRTIDFKWSTELIQIGAVMLNENYQIVDQFMTYIKPQYGRLNSFIERLTGITDDDLINAPTTEEGIKRFLEWIPDDVIMVQWSENDKYQLLREIKGKKIDCKDLHKIQDNWVDCQVQFTQIMKAERIFNLQEALNISDIDYNLNLHDGLVDASNTALLFEKMNMEKPFKFNKYYLETEESNDVLSTSLGDLFGMKQINIA